MMTYAKDILSGSIEDIDYSKLYDILKECSDLYFNEEQSYLTDSEYDLLERIYKNQKDNISIGSSVRTGKVDLPTPMGSLDQVYEGDTSKWLRDNNINGYIVIGDKQDGVSGSSTYVDGNLRISYSRGDGIQGADVSRHLLKIKSSIKNIEYKKILEVRYEIIIPFQIFDDYKQSLIKNNASKIPANARNYVAGQMNSETAEDWFYENALVIITSLQDKFYNFDKSEEYEMLSKLGFLITHYTKIESNKLSDEFLTSYLEDRRKASKTEIDGIVLDINDKSKRKSMEWKKDNLNPPYSRKFKIASEDNKVEATVIKVHWRPSKTGYLKPRVEIEPVNLVGVTISYATGFNAKFIVDNKIGPGSKVMITRAGDVIPHIISVTKPGIVLMPEEEYKWNETNVDIELKDTNNREVIINHLNDVFSELKIPMMRKATIEKLVDAGYNNISTIIKLDASTFKSLIGNSSGEKIFEGIKDKLNPIKLSTLAGASNIFGRGIGIKVMESIAKKYGENKILDNTLTVNQLELVEDIGEKSALLIKSHQNEFIKFINEIDGYFTIKEDEKKESSKLDGLNFCFTGVRSSDLEEYIKNNGGKIVGSIKKDNSYYLICKDKTKESSKLKQARDNIPTDNILTLDEALDKWRK